MIDFIGSRVLAGFALRFSSLFQSSPQISPITFEETKADSVASGSANLANSCASFAETDLADHTIAVVTWWQSCDNRRLPCVCWGLLRLSHEKLPILIIGF